MGQKEPMPKLAKCGCGGDAQILIAHPDENEHILFPHFGVSCKKCNVMIGTTVHGLTDFFDTPHQAAEAWNRMRAARDSEIQKLRDLLEESLTQLCYCFYVKDQDDQEYIDSLLEQAQNLGVEFT